MQTMNKLGVIVYGDKWKHMRAKWFDGLGIVKSVELYEYEARKVIVWLRERAQEKGLESV